MCLYITTEFVEILTKIKLNLTGISLIEFFFTILV